MTSVTTWHHNTPNAKRLTTGNDMLKITAWCGKSISADLYAHGERHVIHTLTDWHAKHTDTCKTCQHAHKVRESGTVND